MTTLERMSCAAVSGMTAELITTPFAVLIVRMQIASDGAPRGFVTTLKDLIKKEGISVLYRGSVPAVLRTLLISGIGVGLYPTARRTICGSNTDPL